ncbi:DNA translocase FtsK 4TM domain-containing protein [Oceanisphaera sp. DM8]|uniref:DNA translocase FtsK n=2 Tax=Oceanisphaera pacifica TaxID=2818389 RepID=A0ABS3NJX7_9GAMM|nr:DNA translocase FtsK 4TM domain-containing protein [Oceanisphaera pacifica]
MSGLQRLFEAGLITIILVAVFMMLSLVSYHPSDPGWSQTAWGGDIRNAAGPAGAWLADILLFVFGFSAYLMPLLMVLVGWGALWRPRALNDICYLTLSLRIIGFLMLLLSLQGLASMNVGNIYYFSSGGLIGDMLVSALEPIVGTLGSTLLLLCAFATGVTFMTGWSWLLIVERLGAGALTAPSWIGSLPQRLANWQMKTFSPNEQERAPALASANTQQAQAAETDVPETGFSGWRRFKDRLTRSNDDEPVAALGSNASTLSEEEDPLLAPLPEQSEQRPKLQKKQPPPRKAAPARKEPTIGAVEEADAPITSIDDANDWAMGEAEEDLDLPWLKEDAEEANTSTAAPQAPAPARPAPRKGQLLPMPSVELLDPPKPRQHTVSEEELDRIARLVEAKLADYNVQANVVGVYPGPVITRFELDLAPGIKVSKISRLDRDLARSLSAISVRVVEVIPGKPYIGLELPNTRRDTVYLREVMDSPAFEESKHPLTMVLGQDIAGEPVIVNLGKMPHVLVAGTTGSGKSVGVNVMILSMLYKATPEEVRFIMIDPKMLELSVYEGIPHLLTEVVTDMKDAANALRWCVGEMERRYKLLSAVGVRNLQGYNTKIQEAMDAGDPIRDPLWDPTQSMDTAPPALEKLPNIVVVIDEFADMMMIVGKKVEELIARIAQKARAAGIHLILATQRPSVDVITGLIKANIPTRMSFQVSSKIDSRTILDQQGAESLLGMGDMLYVPAGESAPTRVHGAFVDDHEVHKVVAAWKERGEPDYIEDILSGDVGAEGLLPGEVPEGGDQENDALYDEAVAFVVETRRGSISGVQRQLKVGYNRAARLIEQMERQGIVSEPMGSGQREVLAPPPVRERN